MERLGNISVIIYCIWNLNWMLSKQIHCSRNTTFKVVIQTSYSCTLNFGGFPCKNLAFVLYLVLQRQFADSVIVCVSNLFP